MRPIAATARFLAAPLLLALPLAACGPGDDGGESCQGLLAGDLVITEVFADADAPPGGSGADEGKEWFEVHNASSEAKDLKGVVVSHGRPDGSSTKTHVLGDVTIAPGQYLVLTNTLPELVPAWGDVGYGAALGDLYNQDGGRLTLMCGPTEIDRATYELVEPGLSRSFDGGRAPDYQANDDPSNWCESDAVGLHEYTPANFGTPKAANQDCVIVVPGQCDDNGNQRATVPPVPGDLTITEVMPNPEAVDDNVGEWFEVLVNRDVDINDLGLDRAGDASMPVVLSSPTCRRVTAGTRLVFARNMDAQVNGMLPRVDGTFNFSLVTGSAGTPGDVRLMMGATELDRLTWIRSAAGRAIQLSNEFTEPADNDVAGNLCDATEVYGAGDRGTPGAANTMCNVNPGAMCTDMGTGQLRPIVKPQAGELVLTEWMPDPSLVTDANGEWFEVRASADFDLNGLQAGTTTLPGTPIVPVAGPCVPITAGSHALFARVANPAVNGMLPMPDGTFGFGLTNSNGNLRIGVDNVVLSMVMWATATAGRSIMTDTDGTQCVAPAGVATYNGTDVGTPRAANSPPECP